MLLFILAALLTLMVVGVLVRPLLRDLPTPLAAEPFNVAVYRDQLQELSAETARIEGAGIVGVAVAQTQASARLEIERRLLTALRRTPGLAATPRAAPVKAAMMLAAGLTVGAGVIYLAVGDPAQRDQPLHRPPASGVGAAPAASPDPLATRADAGHAGLSQMVASLSRKLQAHPDDPDGWGLLARSLMRMDQPGPAVDAYRHARAQAHGASAELDAEYAEARVIAAGGTVDSQALGLFQRLLAADPANPQARYYTALAKVQVGDVAAGLADWRALQAASPADAPWMTTLRQRIAEAEDALQDRSPVPPPQGISPAPADAGATASLTDAGTIASLTDAGTIASLTDAERAKAIDAMVDGLASRLRSAPDDLNGWRELARADAVLGRRDQAAQAQRQIRRLESRTP